MDSTPTEPSTKKRKLSDSLSDVDGSGEADGRTTSTDTSTLDTKVRIERLERDNASLRAENAELKVQLLAEDKACAGGHAKASLQSNSSAVASPRVSMQDEPGYVFPRVSEGMSVAELKTEAWERGYAALDASTRDELLSYLKVGTICLSKVKQIMCQERDPSPIGDGEQTAADIFRLHGFSFLGINEVFDNLAFVSKSFRSRCLQFLDEFCRIYHPSLSAAVDRSPGIGLTYSRLNAFGRPVSTIRGGVIWESLQPSDIGPNGDVDVLVEVHRGDELIWSGWSRGLNNGLPNTIGTEFDFSYEFKAPVPVGTNDNWERFLLFGEEGLSIEKKTLIKALYGGRSFYAPNFDPPSTIPSLRVRVAFWDRIDGTMAVLLTGETPTLGRLVGGENGSPIRVEYTQAMQSRTIERDMYRSCVHAIFSFDLYSAFSQGADQMTFCTSPCKADAASFFFDVRSPAATTIEMGSDERKKNIYDAIRTLHWNK